jgi:hypothetical protein
LLLLLLCVCWFCRQEKLVREHFLAQTPQLLLHWAGDDSLIVLLDVADVSLLTEAKVSEAREYLGVLVTRGHLGRLGGGEWFRV